MDRYKDIVDQAISDLSHAILAITQRDNIKYTLKPHTTNNFNTMVDNYNNSGILEVSIEGCDTSIYKRIAGLSNLRASRAAILLYIDIADQVKYFYKYNKFVENQYTFVIERFKRYLAMESKSNTPDDFLKVYSEYASQIS